MSRDRNSANRAQVRAQRRDAARLQITGAPPPRATIPNPIVFAREGTHRAKDGKPYTITYDQPEES